MDESRHTFMPVVERWLTAVFWLLTAVFAGRLFFAVFANPAAGSMALFDDGVYTNMIWNSAHGDFFRVLCDHSYLETHLSFSLALLGPLFWLWDHPFTLISAQYLMMLAGTALLCRAAVRSGIRPVMVAAIAFFCSAYILVQRPFLVGFHGVCAYFLLIPWLYYTLRFSRRMAWLPLVLTLGLREDSFLFVVPVVLYFAVKERWRTGYILVGLSVAYGCLAMLWLFPFITGKTLLERRGEALSQGRITLSWTWGEVQRKLLALPLVILPLLPFLGRRGVPLFLFVLAPALASFASGFPLQYTLSHHYPATVMPFLAIGIVETIALCVADRRIGECTRTLPAADSVSRALALVVITLGVHVVHGYYLLGGKQESHPLYSTLRRQGFNLARAAQHIPRKGLLLTTKACAAYCANRADLCTEAKNHDAIDLVFLPRAEAYGAWIEEGISNGVFGVRYLDSQFVILQRNYPPSGNAALRAADNMILFRNTLSQGGDNCNDGVRVRHWEGAGRRAPITLSYASSRSLLPGKYAAVFYYRAQAPVRKVRNSWGWFSLHQLNTDKKLAEAEIMPIESAPESFVPQELLFELTEPMKVEPRVTGGDAELWLYSVQFESRQR